MKHLKILGLAVFAVMALTAFVGAGTASATKLYKYTTPSANDALGIGTVIEASLIGGTAPLTNTAGTVTLDTCTGSGVSGTVSAAGDATHTVSGTITALTWTGCTEPTESVDLDPGAGVNYGELEIHSIAGTTNGTVTAKNSIVKVNTTIFEAICEYTVGASLDLGTLVGAKESTGHATLEINTVVPAKNSFFCPDAKWKANYKVTTPTGLTVEAS